MIAPLRREYDEPVTRRASSRTRKKAGKSAGYYWLIIKGCFSLLFIGCAVIAYESFLDVANVPVRAVAIQGNIRYLQKQEVKNTVLPHLDSGFLLINLAAIRAELRELPWVKDVAVRRAWPDRLIVDVQEQIPVARWGKHSLLNADAAIFSPDLSTFDQPLPRLAGPKGSAVEMLSRYAQLSISLAAVDLTVTALEQDQKGSWRVRLDNDLVLVLGRHGLSDRVELFKKLYRTTLHKHGSSMAQIDMRYPNGVTVEWKNNEMPTEFLRGSKS